MANYVSTDTGKSVIAQGCEGSPVRILTTRPKLMDACHLASDEASLRAIAKSEGFSSLETASLLWLFTAVGIDFQRTYTGWA